MCCPVQLEFHLWIHHERGSPVISTTQCMGSTHFFVKKYNLLGQLLHCGVGRRDREKTLIIKQKKIFNQQRSKMKNFVFHWNILWHAYIIQTFQSQTHFESFCLHVFTVEHLDWSLKSIPTLYYSVILWLAAVSDRLSILPLPLSLKSAFTGI